MNLRTIHFVLLAALFFNLGCKAPLWSTSDSKSERLSKSDAKDSTKKKSDDDGDDTGSRSASDADNFAARARKRNAWAPDPYFMDGPARQIEKNLGMK